MALLNSDLASKFADLQERIAGYGRVIVAFSGGLDSGLVLHTSIKTLGPENVLAVTGYSASLPKNDRDSVIGFVARLRISNRHLFVETSELQDAGYVSNPSDRCYFCKRELYGKLRRLAADRDFEYVLDGCNASDADDYRPGRRAAAELSVKSPLLEAGLSKDEIREIARSEDLDIWDKPQSACLSSRIPYGEMITAEKLSMVDKAETYLRETGFRQFRVRHHGQVARIELEVRDIPHILDSGLRERIVGRFREIGFLWVTLDLKPFESGSMNIMIEEGENDRR
jgi:uncharacterized protein